MNEIELAIAAHGTWKSRLRQAISTGKSDLSVATASADDQCAFGKWLYGSTITPALKSDQRYEACKKLHKQFHSAAGKVLSLALAGKKADAEKAMDTSSEFAKASAALTAEMIAWDQAKGH